MEEQSAFDVIIAGGGASACVVGGRLAVADPNLKILIVEAGPPTQEDFAHIQPARYATHLLPESKTIKFLAANPSEALGGRSAIIPTGQCLGGGSSVNFAMYTRAAASDYDDWVTKYGNPGWGYKDLLPYLMKFETYQVDPNTETHGSSGPLKISSGGVYGNVGKDFLDVAAKYDSQRAFTTDVNGLVSGCNEYGNWPKWINKETGHRSDAAHHYIYPQANNKSLVILTGHLVKRVIFENKRAVGIEYVPNARFHPDLPQQTQIARAKRLVIVSAGSLGSPLILERSGIGSAKVLEKNKVETVVDLPGVGDKYQDHQGLFPPFFASEESLTLDGIVRGDQVELDQWTPQWLNEGTGLMASNGIDAGLKLRPTEQELKEIGPDFEARWKEFYADAPDKPVLWFGPLAMFVGDSSAVPKRKYFTIVWFLEHPAAFGHIHITSGEDVNAPPDFQPGYLTKPEDLAVLKWGYKRAREFARRMECYRGELSSMHPKFPQGSEAACKDDAVPVPVDAPNIKWTAEDDKLIEDYIRNYVTTTWHSLGTCPMKPRENGGVVDTRLNVYGVENLKVADLSVAPGNVAANTYSTALAIAERAAVIIAEDLGIGAI
ncbi:alcohol oxidase-like protein [Cristinia sonorae]|uniref:Alcohol oxidase-like protein n=1 Tax=Cristinia sonorae TaxID=1940300 RepID=A0A8K0UE48_9AGAR|nr:alcohol oxidase-like protein [Cristinia sonorae]